jgi:hypothetical protein
VVSEEFASTLDGVSYVTPIPMKVDYSKPQMAVQIMRQRGFTGKAIIAQAYGMRQQPQTESYQTDAWQIAGCLPEFGHQPTVIDKRDYTREKALFFRHCTGDTPVIAVALNSISSPINLDGVIGQLKDTFPEVHFLDMSTVKAHRLYDVLGILDRAKMLITVDSALLHLSRASSCPVFAITNDGWKGSVLPPQAIGGCRYADLNTGSILPRLEAQIRGILREGRVIHAVDNFYPDERHLRAKRMNEFVPRMVTPIFKAHRDTQSIGHHKALPFLKDILKLALYLSEPGDSIIWTNSDIGMDPKVADWAERMKHHGIVTMRRNEKAHCGRDLFLFSHEWLMANWNEIPDYCLGAPIFDLGMAALARKHHGMKARMSNIGIDFLPSDAVERFCLHEPHPQTWDNDSPAARHNGACFAQWLKTHASHIKWTQ